MKTSVLAIAALLPCIAALPRQAGAQTYYYIHTISVDPPSPTPSDPITITLHGDLSSTGAYVVSASASLIFGDTIAIDISAEDPGGFTVLVPHNEAIMIGTLPAGTYNIWVFGTGILETAPPPQHTFVVGGGTGIAAIGSMSDVQVRMENGQLCVTAMDGSALGELTLIDPNGRIAATLNSTASSARMDLSDLAAGAYVLRLHKKATVQRVVVTKW